MPRPFLSNYLQIVILSLIGLFPFLSFAQEQAWQSISIAEGLSQGMVRWMIQSKDGFIWIATKDGLNRYDGYNFKVYTHDPYTPYSISGNTITSLMEDQQGRLWIGTQNDGVNLFDPKTQRFYHARITDPSAAKESSAKGSQEIEFIKELPDGNIYIQTILQKRGYVVAPDLPQQLDFTDRLVPYNQANPHGKLFRNEPFSDWNFKGNAANFWVKKRNEYKSLPMLPSYLKSINQLSDGTFAIGNQSYLWVFTPDDLVRQDSLTVQNAYVTLPTQKGVINVMKDQQDNLWAGTAGYGLLKFNPLTKRFKAFLPSYSLAWLFQDRRQNVYVHANFRPAYRFFKLNQQRNTAEELFTPLDYHLALTQDHQGQFWMVYKEDESQLITLRKYSEDWKLLRQYPIPPFATDALRSIRLIEDDHHLLWLGIDHGNLYKFDPVQEQFSLFSYQSLLPQGGTAAETFALYQDHQHDLWIGTQHGMVRVQNVYTKPTFTIYKNDITHRESLSNNLVSGMVDDPFQPNRYLWVSTKGGGLECLDKTTQQFEHFTMAQGLPNNVVYGVLLGDDNTLWMSTNRGIARLDLKTRIFSTYNKADGLQDDEFNTNSYTKGASGDLLFGGINGLTLFRASTLTQQKKESVVRMIGLKINNKAIEVNDQSEILSEAIEYLPTLNLLHDQNQVGFEFSLMDFTNPSKNRYRYQLEGIDNDWVEAGTNHTANYAQLPDGSYTFRVMGSPNGTVWSKPIELRVEIAPPFYRTWWAYLCYAAVLFFVGYRWYQIQLNRVRLQEQLLFKDQETARLAELDRLKTSLFANISHEFRTPLTLILGPMEQIIQEYASDSRFPMIQRNANRLLVLINQLLDLNKIEAGQAHPEITHLELVRFFRTCTSAFSSLAESRTIHFDVAQDQAEVWGYLDPDKTETILGNLLSNAFKFTPTNGRVAVQLHYSPTPVGGRGVVITVSDNGIGISAQHLPKIFDRFYQIESDTKRGYEGTGIGLALVKELVGVLNGTIRVESQEHQGTTFTVTLPIDQAGYGALAVLKPTGPLMPTPSKLAVSLPSVEATQETSPEQSNVLLIVDDNADIRTYIRQVFENDYFILEAVDGEDGLQKATEQVPDLVISDLMMPKMDGFAFCEALKSNEKTSHIPVVMLTAKATTESRIEGFEWGADEYLTKPFRTDEIQARVRNLIRQRERLRHYFASPAHTEQPIPTEVKVSPIDEAFLQKVHQSTLRHLSERMFGVEQLSQEVHMSTRQLVRKLKALTNQTTVEYIRNIRLTQAASMLKNEAITVSEVAYRTGFESLPYFTKVFQEKYGILPSEFGGFKA
ncbi:MAG: ATP-binding protein [Spirosomataceae bacterium]